MGRICKLTGVAGTLLVLFLSLVALGCGSGSSGKAIPPTITVTLSPSPTASMNVGSTLQFSATVTQNKTVISTPINFISNNNRVLSFGVNGLACAGSWDSSGIVCSPGPPGVVRVLASGYGTPSATTTVYVHPQVTSIQAASMTTPAPACVPQNQTENFQATVFSGGTDITPFVGPLNWSVVDSTVAKTSTTITGLQPNQVQVTADQPGATQIFANISGVNGQSVPFETCPVQSISVVASSTGTDLLQLASGSSAALAPTVLDTQGNSITVNGLTWISTQPGVATAKGASVSAVSPGGAGAFPVCAPPGCNVNLYPIYSSNVVSTTVTGSTAANTVFVTSTGCFGTAVPCQTSLIPIDTQTNTAGTALIMPSAPSSFLVDPTGTRAYFGTTGGLRILTLAGSTLLTAGSVKGKVLAVSPDDTLVIVSDTTDSPNAIYVFNSKTNATTPFLISGVTAAAFSPDSTSAYLLAGSTLYLYSTTHPLQTISLPAPATGAAFLATGAFGFVARTDSAISLFNGCNGAPPASPNTATVATSAQPNLLTSLPDGKTMVAVDTTGFTSVAVATSAAGCPPPVSATASSINFGQGSFTPKQVLVSSDGNRIYVLSNLSTVIIYDFRSRLVQTITLSPSATPLSGALSLSGNDLYVGASDGTVHHLDTVRLQDAGQIPVTLCNNNSVSCPPDIVALRP